MKKSILTVALCALSFSAMSGTKKVMIIGLNGTLPAAIDQGIQNGSFPQFSSLVKSGAINWNMTSVADVKNTHNTFSAPNWASLLTGVEPEHHGIVNNDIENPHAVDSTFKKYNPKKYPPVMMYMDKIGIESSGYIAWPALDQTFGRYFTHRATTTDGNDAAIIDKVVADLPTTSSDFIFIQMSGIENVGNNHGYGYNTPAYKAAIQYSDNQLKRVLTALKGRKDFKNEEWLLFVMTDHGGNANGTSYSNGNLPENFNTFLIVNYIKKGKWQDLPTMNNRSSDASAITPAVMNFLEFTPDIPFDSQPVAIFN